MDWSWQIVIFFPAAILFTEQRTSPVVLLFVLGETLLNESAGWQMYITCLETSTDFTVCDVIDSFCLISPSLMEIISQR